VGSFVGGILSVVGLTLLAPPLASLAVSFGPPEYVALTVLGILVVTYLTVLPVNGNQEVLTGLLGGNTTAGSVNLSQDMLPSIESGALRVLAVGTDQRLSYLDAPTFLEQGYPEITQSTTTFEVIAPTGTPAPGDRPVGGDDARRFGGCWSPSGPRRALRAGAVHGQR
jgi:hypothetical protein